MADLTKSPWPLRRPRVLIVSLAPYRFATRTRKAAVAYRATADVVFLGLQGVGRTGKRDRSGASLVDGIHVRQVPVRPLTAEPGLWHQLRNVLWSYTPSFARLVYHAIRTPADVVHVTGAPLALVGWLHKLRHRSVFLLDVNERPASVTSSGSLFSVFSRFEPSILRAAASRADITTVVTPGHADILEGDFSFANVLVVRNAPLCSWRAAFLPSPAAHDSDIAVVTVGTIFEGRAFEHLLNAVAISRRAGVDVRLQIYGTGRKSYLDRLALLATELKVTDLVSFEGALDSSNVSKAYLGGQIGLALYEQEDAGNDSLSNKILECVSSGRPVLAGDLPENRRFLTEHEIGWLTPVDAASISKAFVDIAGRSSLLAPLALTCRRLGDQQLNWEHEFAKVVGATQSLVRHEVAVG
jgi:glycosyltransferase involved in cell wall biosynthesis